MALSKYTTQREKDKFEEVADKTTIRIIPYGTRDRFSVNDIEESGDVTYIGKEDKQGNWYVIKIDESSDIVINHATEDNNDETTYTTAWTNRASLTYEDFSSAF